MEITLEFGRLDYKVASLGRESGQRPASSFLWAEAESLALNVHQQDFKVYYEFCPNC